MLWQKVFFVRWSALAPQCRWSTLLLRQSWNMDNIFAWVDHHEPDEGSHPWASNGEVVSSTLMQMGHHRKRRTILTAYPVMYLPMWLLHPCLMHWLQRPKEYLLWNHGTKETPQGTSARQCASNPTAGLFMLVMWRRTVLSRGRALLITPCTWWCRSSSFLNMATNSWQEGLSLWPNPERIMQKKLFKWSWLRL